MRTPMPSPNGTNFAGLYLSGRETGAYDSAGGLPNNAVGGLDDNVADQIRQFLRGKLSDADYKTALEMLDGGGLEDHAMDRLPPQLQQQVRDALADQRRRQDADFAKRFPGAVRIGHAW